MLKEMIGLSRHLVDRGCPVTIRQSVEARDFVSTQGSQHRASVFSPEQLNF